MYSDVHCLIYFFLYVGYNLENQDVRLTKVINNHTYFNPPCLCLSQYLEQEVHKTVNKIERKFSIDER